MQGNEEEKEHRPDRNDLNITQQDILWVQKRMNKPELDAIIENVDEEAPESSRRH